MQWPKKERFRRVPAERERGKRKKKKKGSVRPSLAFSGRAKEEKKSLATEAPQEKGRKKGKEKEEDVSP